MQTTTEYIFEQLEEQGIVFKSANNLLHISISASNYLDIKRLAKAMEKEQIIESYKDSTCQFSVDSRIDYPKSAEQYYKETYGK